MHPKANNKGDKNSAPGQGGQGQTDAERTETADRAGTFGVPYAAHPRGEWVGRARGGGVGVESPGAAHRPLTPECAAAAGRVRAGCGPAVYTSLMTTSQEFHRRQGNSEPGETAAAAQTAHLEGLARLALLRPARHARCVSQLNRSRQAPLAGCDPPKDKGFPQLGRLWATAASLTPRCNQVRECHEAGAPGVQFRPTTTQPHPP